MDGTAEEHLRIGALEDAVDGCSELNGVGLLYIYVYIYIYLYICICICIYIYPSVYLCMHLCMYVCMYIYINTNETSAEVNPGVIPNP